MAHFWTHVNSDGFRGLVMIPLDNHDDLEFTGDHGLPLQPRGQRTNHSGAVVLKEKTESGHDIFIVLSKQDGKNRIMINGDRLQTGIRLLKHRDEVVVLSAHGAAQRLYFSSERKAGVDHFYEAGRAVSCIRCRQKLVPGDPVVRCPSCNAAHHQSHDLPCWTYSPHCGNGMCSQSTVMGEEYRWIPDYLFRR